MTKAAVIHGLRGDSRPTTIQNVTSISKYLAVEEILNVNVFGLIPHAEECDVVVLTYDFLALRTWPIWKVLVNRIAPIIQSARLRVAMPQDDYSYCDILDTFICDLAITHVYSPITLDLDLLYPRAMARHVRFGKALTGYVDEEEFRRVSVFAKPFAERELDLGQRVRSLAPHLGGQASIKGQLATNFSKTAVSAGFRCDVSTRPQDVFLGDDWYRFLGNTRFTVGAKGGASLADPRGRLADQVRRMRIRHPSIENDEIVARLKTRRGRKGDFRAISPRMFEAASMGVCQILQRDEYFEGFEPWKHYVPIESTSQLGDDVFKVMRDHVRASEIVELSRDFLIGSGNFTYGRFLEQLADDMGITKARSGPHVRDSSSELDAATGNHGVALRWVQSYLARALANGNLRRVESSLAAGRLLVLNECDREWASHAESNRESLLQWVEALRSKRLLVESVAIPWRSVSSFL